MATRKENQNLGTRGEKHHLIHVILLFGGLISILDLREPYVQTNPYLKIAQPTQVIAHAQPRAGMVHAWCPIGPMSRHNELDELQ